MATNNWYCTCNKGKRKNMPDKHNKIFPTKVDKDDCCIYCGHYAFASPLDKYDRYPIMKKYNGQWLREVTRSKCEWTRKFGRGGVDLFKAWSQKHNLISHGFNDQELFEQEDKTNEKNEWGDYIKHAGNSRGNS